MTQDAGADFATRIRVRWLQGALDGMSGAAMLYMTVAATPNSSSRSTRLASKHEATR